MSEFLLEGDRVEIRRFSLEDAYSMTNWGKHKSLLFDDYNFPFVEEEDIKEWYETKTFGWSKIYFSVYNEEKSFIGYLGIRYIKRLKRESTLGIVFDPNYINKGYGTEALKLFLSYYFEELNMNVLNLEVDQFNKRAIKCYEKCGFVIYKKYTDIYYDQSVNLRDSDFKEAINSFVIKRKKLYNYVYKMYIDKKTYFKMKESE